MKRKTKVHAILMAFALIPSLGSAAIYKCTAQDGSITYTDLPCPAETAEQSIDPGVPTWLNAMPQIINPAETVTDGTAPTEPEALAMLCANDEFRVWLKAQRQTLPEREVRTAKFAQLSNLCRKALHLPVVATLVALPIE